MSSSDAADEIERTFLDALQRLEEGKPRHKKLKAKAKAGCLKVNISNVALEADRSRTLIGMDNCRYPRVREAILLAQGGRQTIPNTYTQLIADLRANLAQVKTENKMLQATISDHFLARKTAEKKAEAQMQTNSRLRKELDRLSKVVHLAGQNEPTAPRLVLIRGLPGSGKTTRAKNFAADGYEHFEADMFFEIDGQYLFDPDKLSEAHAWCLQQTRDALTNGSHVVVANVFASVEDIKPYTTLGFNYEIVEVAGKGQSVHDVPVEVLRGMKAAWVPMTTLRESLKPRAPTAKVTPIRSPKENKPK